MKQVYGLLALLSLVARQEHRTVYETCIYPAHGNDPWTNQTLPSHGDECLLCSKIDLVMQDENSKLSGELSSVQCEVTRLQVLTAHSIGC